MKNAMVVALLAALLVASPARAQLGGLPGKPKVPEAPSAGGGSATPADVESFLKSANAADALVSKSAVHLFKAVASKEQIEKYDAQMKAAKATNDPKEAQAKIDRANAEVLAVLEKANYEEANKKLQAEHDAKKNDGIKNGIWNLALGALKDAELVATGKKLVSGVPSPAIAGQIPAAKDALSKLVSQADGLTKVVSSAKSLMTTVGLEALPTKASEAPRPVAEE